MKTEEFDDAVRRKIENINLDYTEEDIDRVYNYVNGKHNTASLLKRYGFISLVSTGCLMISGLLFWNFAQMKEQKQLLLIIDTLRCDIAEVKAKTPLVKTDTVFIKEYIPISSSNKGTHAEQAVTTGKNKLMVSNESASINKNDGKKIVKQEKPIIKKESGVEQIADSRENKFEEGESKGNKKAETTEATNFQKNQTEVITTNSTEQGNWNSDKNTSPQLADSTSKETLEADNKKEKENAQSSHKDLNNSSPDNSSSDNKKSHDKIFSFNNIHYQTGIGFENAHDAVGLSLLGEIFLNKRWSTSTGLKVLSIENEKYADEDDFNEKEGKNFQSAYNLSETSDISGIEIRRTFLQIPLMLTYHLPLKDNFSLLFGAGTDIDIYAKQGIQYIDIGNNNQEEHKKLAVKNPALFFNNVVLNAGIQKEWKYFVLQASPFISAQLTSVADIYKKEDIYFGLRLGVFYSFGKE